MQVKKGKNITKISAAILILIISVLFYQPAYAGTAELASMTAHYAHPVTGQVEDPGKNAGIGQGMAQGVLGSQALIETDDRGALYITVRIKMASQFRSTSFAVQRAGASYFSGVAPRIVQKGQDWVDYRFQIPSKNSVIRMELFVIQMDRNVIFYGRVGKTVPGSGNFKVSVNNSGVNNSGEVRQNSQNTQRVTMPHGDETLENAQGTPSQKSTKDFSEGIGYDHGLLTKDSPEIKQYIADTKLAEDGQDDGKGKDEQKKPLGEASRFVLTVLAVVVGMLIASIVLMAIIIPIMYKHVRTKNNTKEAILYDKEKMLKKSNSL